MHRRIHNYALPVPTTDISSYSAWPQKEMEIETDHKQADFIGTFPSCSSRCLRVTVLWL